MALRFPVLGVFSRKCFSLSGNPDVWHQGIHCAYKRLTTRCNATFGYAEEEPRLHTRDVIVTRRWRHWMAPTFSSVHLQPSQGLNRVLLTCDWTHFLFDEKQIKNKWKTHKKQTKTNENKRGKKTKKTGGKSKYQRMRWGVSGVPNLIGRLLHLASKISRIKNGIKYQWMAPMLTLFWYFNASE